MPDESAKWVPGALVNGTEVGLWRVVGVLGRGGNGTVYRVERVGSGDAGPFALKLAHRPQDARLEQEVELLSRIRHPQVPRLHDHGWWTHPSGVVFPYLVMDGIEGTPLYEWASWYKPSSRQVLRVLAELAWALEATHRADCVHRDVKGANVLVSTEGHCFLTDFGAGDFKGARTLTHEVLPPGTRQYRSPQALRFHWYYGGQQGAHYSPGPTDDVHALGVTAYRLVTGSYLESEVDPELDVDPASASSPRLLPPRELATVCRELDNIILRMLSDAPEARGSAREIAQALERAADSAGHKADAPIAPRPRKATPTRALRWGDLRQGRVRMMLGLAAAVGSLALIAPVRWVAQELRCAGEPEGGVVALGDAATLVPVITAGPSASSAGVGLDMPKKPFTGQRLPPCRQGFEVEIELIEGNKDTRSCWIKGDVHAPACKANGYEYQGGCYVPSYPPPKLPQSVRP